MDRKSEPFHAEIECDIVRRPEGDIDYKGLANAGEKVLVETGEGGAAATPEAGTPGETSGKLGEKVAETQQPRSPQKAGRLTGVKKDVGAQK